MFLEFFKRWIIPSGWLSIGRKVINKLSPEEEIVIEQPQFDRDNLLKFKDIHKGKRCFILASGPSIKEQDLSGLRNEYCIAVSQFFLHPDINKIKPQYHCFAAQHSPFDNETNKIIFDNYTKYYTYPVKCFIGTKEYEYSYYNFLQNNSQYQIDAAYIDYNSCPILDETNYQDPEIWDITQKPFSLNTVIYEAIQVAYYMGFSEIYLLGVDHNYLNDIHSDGHHFYEESKSFSDKEHLDAISLERWFLIYHTRWKQYRLMQTYLNSMGVKIYNATPKSMLDVFPRVALKDVLA